MFYVLIAIAAVAVLYYLFVNQRPKNFPPAPWSVPIFGHLLHLGFDSHSVCMKWKEKYGWNIVGVNFGVFNTVIISDYAMIKEAMNESTFAGRPKIPFVYHRSDGVPEGIIFTDGRKWQEQRRFTLRHLRDFGFGTKTMESIVQEEIKELIESFKATAGIPISTMNKFNVSVVNALWTITTGERLKHDDPELKKVIEMITASLEHKPIFMFAIIFPKVIDYAPNLSGFMKALEPVLKTRDFIRPYVESHFKTHQPGQPRDFLDSYIDEIKNTEDPTSSFHISKKNSIIFTMLDLFIAGAETTSTTLTWIFLYMARHQHVQEKLAAEIQKVVGNSRLPALSDRPQMPYTEAVIHEVMRAVTLIPLSVMHSTTEDVVFHGYNIPKDTMVMANLYEAHNNISLWGDPENFRPERFLTKDESQFVRREGFIPFSSGKRVCLGESLARDELFLFTTSLFQVFQVDLDKNSPPPTLEPKNGAVMMTQPHKLVLTLRDG